MMTARTVTWAIAGTALLTVLAVVIARGEIHLRERPAMEVETAAPEPFVPEHHEAGFVGVIVATDVVELRAPADARLLEVSVRLGDRVARGQTLAALDAAALRAELAGSRAALTAALAMADRAKLERRASRARHRRRLTLDASGWLGAEEVEAVAYEAKLSRPRLTAARAEVARRRAQLEKLEVALHEAVLVAPFDAAVAARLVDPGARVAAGTPLLRLVSTEGAWVRFAADELRAGALQVGRRIVAHLDGHATMLEGIVEKVAPQVDAASRLVTAEARLQCEDAACLRWLGRMVRVRLVGDDR